MTELDKKQIVFTKYLSHLFTQFYETEICMGETWRSDETCELYAKEGKGIALSCHELRLAVDLIVRVNGTVSNNKSEYAAMGQYWKRLPSLFPADIAIVTCWGGDFVTLCDFYHFSIGHNGIR